MLVRKKIKLRSVYYMLFLFLFFYFFLSVMLFFIVIYLRTKVPEQEDETFLRMLFQKLRGDEIFMLFTLLVDSAFFEIPSNDH